MKILALDTATESCSAALYQDGGIISRYQLAPRKHSQLILKMIDELMQEAGVKLSNLDAIAFGRGPGAFMGVRIAAGVVQGLAFAQDLPVIPVSNLLAIAAEARYQTGAENILCAIDARMSEVYWAAYQFNKTGSWENIVDECVCSPQRVIYPNKGIWLGAGTGWGSYADRLSMAAINLKTILPACLPSATAIVHLAVKDYQQGRTVVAAEAQPVYLRNNVAKKPQQKTYASYLNLKNTKSGN